MKYKKNKKKTKKLIILENLKMKEKQNFKNFVIIVKYWTNLQIIKNQIYIKNIIK